MSIKVINRSLNIPISERTVGHIGDNLVETRIFELSRMYNDVDLSEFDFKLDTQVGDVKNIIDLDKTVTEDKITLTWIIEESHILISGRMDIQLRAFKGQIEKWHSLQDYVLVQTSINATDVQPSPLPSEFEQMEQRVTVMKTQAEAAAQTAEEQANIVKVVVEDAETEVLPAVLQAIEDAGDAKDLLNGSIEAAGTAKSQLDGSISDAGTAKTGLEGSISNAGTVKEQLDGSISSAGTAKDELDGSISTAGEAKSALDESIQTGDLATFKDEVEAFKNDCATKMQLLTTTGTDIIIDWYHYGDSRFTTKIGHYASTAGWTVSAIYDSYYFTAERDMDLYISSAGEGDYLQLVIFLEGIMDSAHFVRYRTTDSNLPTFDSPVRILEGDIVVVSTTPSNKTWSAAEKHITEDVYINTNLIKSDDIAESIANKLKNKVQSESDTRLSIYIPAKIGYIKYAFVHVNDPNINADVWHMGNTHSVNNNYETRFIITTSGAWEMALHLSNRDDFSGGSAHGDEILTSIIFVLDGVPKNPNDLTAMTDFEELRIVQKSNVYDPADHTTIIAEHGSEHIFTKDGLTINQTVKWLVNAELTGNYIAMFPVAKKDVYNPSIIVTDTYYTDVSYEPIEFATPLSRIIYKAKSITSYSSISGFCGTFSITDYPTGLPGGDGLLLADNGTTAYNKQYYLVCNGGSVSPGDTWKASVHYKLQVGEGSYFNT